MSVETKQCSICVDAPPYRQCLAVGADECAYVVSLEAALREALDQWDSWNHSELEGTRGWLGNGKKHNARIAALRAQFLDDK